MKKKIVAAKIADIVPDDKNFNKGSEVGKKALNRSFQKFGAGRSILIDKNNQTIAGNKSAEAFKEAGFEKVLIVEADAETLVAVKRTDIDLNSAEGREMALADNQTQALNYVLDEDVLRVEAEAYDIDTNEWGIDIEQDGQKKKIKEEALRPYDQTHVLISFAPELLVEIEEYLEKIKAVPGIEFEQASN